MTLGTYEWDLEKTIKNHVQNRIEITEIKMRDIGDTRSI